MLREFEPFIVDAVAYEDVIEMMDVMGDVNPVHSDRELVAELGLRGLVNQGPANLAYALNMLIGWAGDPGAVLSYDVRFNAITCPGDRLVALGGVESVTDGIADCSFRLERDIGDGTTELILTGSARVTAPEEDHAR